MDFRLGFGPMSREIVDILLEYSTQKQRNVMIIASRNQVDANSGYVMSTNKLGNSVRENKKINSHVMLCRDHCGPYFLDNEKSWSLPAALKATQQTISHDIENGFDLIHIDTSRVTQEYEPYKVAEQLINFCLKLNSNIKFEFGTEENVGVVAGAIKYRQDLDFAKNFPNMTFVVAQTGSLCFEDAQVGTFENKIVKELVELANSNHVGLKEHNADYLTAEQIKMRQQTGVHALNIAPQLGVIQTKLLKKLSMQFNEQVLWNNFSNTVLTSNKWKKWTKRLDNEQRVIVAGHYCFASSDYEKLVKNLNHKIDFYDELKYNIFNALDLYYDNLQ